MRPIRGSFAYRPGESANPHLWAGNVLAYAPCVIGAGRNVPDLSPSRFDFVFVGSAAALSVLQSPIGPATQFVGNVALEQQDAPWGLPCKILTPADEDVVIVQSVFRFNHSAGAKESTIFWSDNPTVGSNQFGYRLWVDNNTDKLRFGVFDNSDGLTTGSITRYTSATTLTPGRWYNAVVVFHPLMASDSFYGQRCMMFLDGIMEFPTVGPGNYPTSTGEGNGSHLASQHSRVGSALGVTQPDVAVALIHVWNNRWMAVWDTFDESLATVVHFIRQVSADPLAMYRRRKPVFAKSTGRLISIGGTALRRSNVIVAG